MARKDEFGYGNPTTPFDRTIKNREGFPARGLYPNYYDESGTYTGLNETPSTGTGIGKKLVGMPEAWQYDPTGPSLDTSEIDFSNKNQVMAIQSAIGADVDGVWGPQTEKLYREHINARRGKMGLDEYTYGQPEATTATVPASNLQIVMPSNEFGFNNVLYPNPNNPYDQGSLFDLGGRGNDPYKIYE